MNFRIILITVLQVFTSSQFSYSQTSDSVTSKNTIISSSLFGYIPGQFNEANYNLDVEVYLENRKSLALNFGVIKSYGSSGG